MSKHKNTVSQVSDVHSPELTEGIIRTRAYQLFEQRGYEPGHDLDDWLQAEAELIGEKPSSRAELTTKLHRATAA